MGICLAWPGAVGKYRPWPALRKAARGGPFACTAAVPAGARPSRARHAGGQSARPCASFFWVAPESGDGALMLSMGLLGAGAHFVLIKAFEHAPASTLAPFIYSGLLWAIVLGWAVFGDLPDATAVAGMAIILASGVYVVTHRRAGARPSGRGVGGPRT